MLVFGKGVGGRWETGVPGLKPFEPGPHGWEPRASALTTASSLHGYKKFQALNFIIRLFYTESVNNVILFHRTTVSDF